MNIHEYIHDDIFSEAVFIDIKHWNNFIFNIDHYGLNKMFAE